MGLGSRQLREQGVEMERVGSPFPTPAAGWACSKGTGSWKVLLVFVLVPKLEHRALHTFGVACTPGCLIPSLEGMQPGLYLVRCATYGFPPLQGRALG